MPAHGEPPRHGPTHEDGGADEIDVTGLSGLLADDQHVLDAEVLAVAAALLHEDTHVLGGADDIDSALNALAIALTTQGDIVYRAAALNTLARLAAGVAGQALLTGGPAANPSWGAPVPAVHGAAEHTDVTRELFIPALDDVDIQTTLENKGDYLIISVDGTGFGASYFTFKVPDDFVSFTSIKLVWMADTGLTGNMYWRLHTDYAAAGESYNTHSEDPAGGTTNAAAANTIYVQEPANALTMGSLALGDYIGIEFNRDADHASDTIEGDVKMFGLLFTYTANQ